MPINKDSVRTFYNEKIQLQFYPWIIRQFKRWALDVIFGIFAGVIFAEVLPLNLKNIGFPEGNDNYLGSVNKIIWGLIWFSIAAIFKVIRGIPAKVNQELEPIASDISIISKSLIEAKKQIETKATEHKNELAQTLIEHEHKIAETYYKGFYRLLSGLSEDFLEFETQLQLVCGVDSPLRGVVLDFVVRSLASIGKNGFAMVDAEVDMYVKYIVEALQRSKQIVMTCIVRPYWFVTDEIKGVTLPPYDARSGFYGKGEHLKYFANVDTLAQRWMILDEKMIADIILTAWIDKYFCENIIESGCPICKIDSAVCSFHANRQKTPENMDDIPEIWWFQRQVNEDRKVELIYTRVDSDWVKSKPAFQDRIFISNPMKLEIQFEFTNLSKGNLWIRWGNKVVELNRIHQFAYPSRISSGTNLETHTFYRKFSQVIEHFDLKNDEKRIIDKVNNHIKFLKDLISKNFNDSNTSRIQAEESSIDTLKNSLGIGNHNEFKQLIIAAIDDLSTELLKTGKLMTIYNELLTFYSQKRTLPKTAYVLAHDPHHPEYPIRIARQQFNWDGDGNNSKGILNAPD